MSRYKDIINLPHYEPKQHPRMKTADRAAQFSPFAALTGHEGAVKETARLTDRRIELSEDMQAALDEKLRQLRERINEQPEVNIIYFVPDSKKDGGAYASVTGKIKKINDLKQTVTMADSKEILIADILEMTIQP